MEEGVRPPSPARPPRSRPLATALRRGRRVALAGGLLAGLGGCGHPGGPPRGAPPLRLGTVAVPTAEERATGPALEVGVAGDVVVACREDGSLSLVAPSARRRIAPPPGERFRHVAAAGRRALALTSRGLVHAVDLDLGTTRPLAGKTQGTSRVVVGPDLVAWVGIEGGALFRVGPDATEVETAWPSGDEPISSLAADAGRVFVAHADGTVEWTPDGGKTRAPLLTGVPSVTAMAADADGVALGDAEGTVRWTSLPRGSSTPGPWTSVQLEAPIRAMACLPGHLLVALRSRRLVLLRTPTLARAGALDHAEFDVRSLAVAPGGRRVILATSDAAGVRELVVERDGGAGSSGR